MKETAGAGASEMQRYLRARREWRRKTRVARWILLAMIVALTLFIQGRDYMTWILGLVTGALVALYVSARDDLPEWVERHLWGAIGERKTAKELGTLSKSGYIVRNDIRRDQGNWDHIVIGPGGIFLIDSKNLGGPVAVDGDDVHVIRGEDGQDGYRRSLGPQVRGQAYGLNREIESATGLSPWVQGVVCFWNRFDEGFFEHDRAVFLHGSQLAEWIAARPQRLVGSDLRAVLGYLAVQDRR